MTNGAYRVTLADSGQTECQDIDAIADEGPTHQVAQMEL